MAQTLRGLTAQLRKGLKGESISDAELVAFLREYNIGIAADRIEALSIVNAALIVDRDRQAKYKEYYREAYNKACLQLQETEAKLAKAIKDLGFYA